MAAAVVDYAPECGALVERALADSEAGEVTPFHDQAHEAAFFMALHLLDRIALRHLGFADRELYMNALLGALKATMPAEKLRSGYAQVQTRYGSIKKLVADEGEPLKGTLFWKLARESPLIMASVIT